MEYNPSIRSKRLILRSIGIVFVIVLAMYTFVYRAPKNFPSGTLFNVEKNMTLNGITEHLKNENIIRSEFLFKTFVVVMGGDRNLLEGDYFFKKPVGTFTVAKRIVNGEFGLSPVKITIPEGSSVREIAVLLNSNLAEFNTPLFIKLAEKKEGYLFPDTYFLFPNASSQTVIQTFEDNFAGKIATIKEDIDAHSKTLEEIIIMASIVEEEGRTPESRKMIADILWRRLENGMPLQVDAPFVYILGKGSADLTVDDLAIDSPYNTYKYAGLPPGPITNPGLESILATIKPTQNEYLYFLTGNDGEMYYAKTFDEHVINKQKYIKSQ